MKPESLPLEGEQTEASLGLGQKLTDGERVFTQEHHRPMQGQFWV